MALSDKQLARKLTRIVESVTDTYVGYEHNHKTLNNLMSTLTKQFAALKTLNVVDGIKTAGIQENIVKCLDTTEPEKVDELINEICSELYNMINLEA